VRTHAFTAQSTTPIVQQSYTARPKGSGSVEGWFYTAAGVQSYGHVGNSVCRDILRRDMSVTLSYLLM